MIPNSFCISNNSKIISLEHKKARNIDIYPLLRVFTKAFDLFINSFIYLLIFYLLNLFCLKYIVCKTRQPQQFMTQAFIFIYMLSFPHIWQCGSTKMIQKKIYLHLYIYIFSERERTRTRQKKKKKNKKDMRSWLATDKWRPSDA